MTRRTGVGWEAAISWGRKQSRACQGRLARTRVIVRRRSRPGRRRAGRAICAGPPAGGRDDGSVTVVIVGVVTALLLLGGCLAMYASAAVAAERARLAADQAALAGASVLLGSSASPASSPCAFAATTAERNGARVVGCDVRATSVQVQVVVPAPLGRQARGVARAGSPEGAGQ